MKNVIPLSKWVVINIINKEQTVGGILLPDSHAAEHNEFIVESVGDEVTKIKPGDSIVCLPQNAIKIDIPSVEKNKALIEEKFILGKLIPKGD